MQNKYIRTSGYSIVIVFMIVCIILSCYRYRADMFFSQARHCIPVYINNGQGLAYMQDSYNNAIRCNPLEAKNYARKLNGEYLRKLASNSRRK